MNNLKKTTLAIAFTTAIAMPLTVNAEQTGQQIFNSVCSACHGSNGKGRFPGTPNFTDPAGPLSQSDSVLIDHISNGFKSKGRSGMAMPAQKNRLSQKEISDTVKYLKQTFKK